MTANSLLGNLTIVAVDATIVAVMVLAIALTNEAVEVADADNALSILAILEMVLVLVDVTDNVGVRVIVSWSLIATLFTLDPFIAILTKCLFQGILHQIVVFQYYL